LRLLFDERLSARLCSMLADSYPDSLHVGQIGLAGAQDEAIWSTAAERGCILVTKDEDFHRLSVSQDEATFLALGW
jgi:predicted nuclease of predicted toxin-antitoxin system